MIDFDRIMAVKRDAQARLRAIPGVHAVAVGAKIVAGKRTSEPAILVYTTRKKAPSEIPAEEMIPAEIDGVKTDVTEEEIPKLRETAEGGQKISPGEYHFLGGNYFGTLGCIAISKDKSKVYGITNEHVVNLGERDKAQLTVELDDEADGSTKKTITTFGGTVRSGSLVYANFEPDKDHRNQYPPLPEFGAFYTVQSGDSLDNVAEGILKAINDLHVPTISATPTATGVITLFPGPGYVANCSVSTPVTYPSSDLRVTLGGNQITFSGRVSGDNYGVFTNVTVGGLIPSFGVFTPVAKSTSLNDIATNVAGSLKTTITALQAESPDWTALSQIQVTPSAASVTISGVEEVDCETSGDVRVGQPCLCSICSRCCGPRIGVVTAARRDLDAALIQLDPGLSYLAEISGMSIFITGSDTVTPADALPGNYRVSKSGGSSGLTYGFVTAVDRVGYTSIEGATSTGVEIAGPFDRQYAGVMEIRSDGSGKFLDDGDSGAAILNMQNKVVGILFGGSLLMGLATPIASITTEFNIDIATASRTGDTQTVPGAPQSAVQMQPLFQPAFPQPISGAIPIGQQLQEVQREVVATEMGREYADVVRRHAAEVQMLINTNRRVGAMWQRSGGPQIVQVLFGMLHRRDQPLPAEIDGKPFSECVHSIGNALLRYASPALTAALRRYVPDIAGWSGLTYAQWLASLHARGAAQ